MSRPSFNLKSSSIYIIIMLQMNWTQPLAFDPCFYTYYDLSAFISWPNPFFRLFLPNHQKQVVTCPNQAQNIPYVLPSPKTPKEKQEGKEGTADEGSLPHKIKIVKKREREDNFLKKKQKKNRNLPSNILKIFILNLYTHPNLQQALYGQGVKTPNFNLQILVQKMKNIITTTQNYIRPATVQQIYSEHLLGEEEGRTFRTLIKKFLLLELPMIITPLRKYRRREKRQILGFARKILNNLSHRHYV